MRPREPHVGRAHLTWTERVVVVGIFLVAGAVTLLVVVGIFTSLGVGVQ